MNIYIFLERLCVSLVQRSAGGEKKCIFCLGLLNVFVRLMPPMGNKQKKVVACQASAKWDNDNHVLS